MSFQFPVVTVKIKLKDIAVVLESYMPDVVDFFIKSGEDGFVFISFDLAVFGQIDRCNAQSEQKQGSGRILPSSSLKRKELPGRLRREKNADSSSPANMDSGTA